MLYPLIAVSIAAVAYPLTALLVLNPFEQTVDFELSDFYIRTANRRTAPRLSNDIVLIPVDAYSRSGIVDVVRAVDSLGAAATVVDVFMMTRQDGDDTLAAKLGMCRNLIVPNSKSDDFDYSLYANLESSEYGYAELSTESTKEVIRYYESICGDLNSLAATATKLYNDTAAPQGENLINFVGKDFEVLDPSEFVDLGGLVKGKIAIIANLNDFGDVHRTPIGYLPGATIHAYIIQTILDDSTPRPARTALPYVVAFIICILLFLGHLYINLEVNGDVANLAFRVAQLVLLYLIYLTGASVFIHYNTYFDFSITLLLIAAASVLFDITFGIIGLLFPKLFK